MIRDWTDFETPQDFEAAWWGTAANTFGEEAKQITYAHRMGLEVVQDGTGRWPVYDLAGKSVLDLGGGPVSMLLKTRNGALLTVVDPCPYPTWVKRRYEHAGIAQHEQPAETFETNDEYDECWTYNCLQHVLDPEAVIETARKHAKVLRIFEWIETETNVGHPHTLHADDLRDWIGGTGEGQIENVNENGAVGLAYYGVFQL